MGEMAVYKKKVISKTGPLFDRRMNRLMSPATRGKALGLKDAGWSLAKIAVHLGVTKLLPGPLSEDLQSLGPGNFLTIMPKPGEINAMANSSGHKK